MGESDRPPRRSPESTRAIQMPPLRSQGIAGSVDRSDRCATRARPFAWTRIAPCGPTSSTGICIGSASYTRRAQASLRSAHLRSEPETGQRPALEICGARRGAPRFRGNAVLPADRSSATSERTSRRPSSWRKPGKRLVFPAVAGKQVRAMMPAQASTVGDDESCEIGENEGGPSRLKTSESSLS